MKPFAVAMLLLASALLTACAGMSPSAGATAAPGDPYARCIGNATADCYGGPP